MSKTVRHIHWPQVLIGVLALVLGGVFYILARPPSQTYFVPAALSLFQGDASVFGALGYHLPTFLHVFAFSLITVGFLGSDLRGAVQVCLLWFSIDALFEIGQHPWVAGIIVPHVPDWFSAVPVLDNVAVYFERGSFDVFDLLSILLGAVAAYGVVGWFSVKNSSGLKSAG
jgi:hypothetical protein